MWTMPGGWRLNTLQVGASDTITLRELRRIGYDYDQNDVAHWSRTEARLLSWEQKVGSTPPRTDTITVFIPSEDPPGTGRGIGFDIPPNLAVDLDMDTYEATRNLPNLPRWRDFSENEWSLKSELQMSKFNGTALVGPSPFVLFGADWVGLWFLRAVGALPLGYDAFFGNTRRIALPSIFPIFERIYP